MLQRNEHSSCKQKCYRVPSHLALTNAMEMDAGSSYVLTLFLPFTGVTRVRSSSLPLFLGREEIKGRGSIEYQSRINRGSNRGSIEDQSRISRSSSLASSIIIFLSSTRTAVQYITVQQYTILIIYIIVLYIINTRLIHYTWCKFCTSCILVLYILAY